MHVLLEVGQARLFDHLYLGRFGVHDRIGEEIEHVGQVLVTLGQLVGVKVQFGPVLIGVGGIVLGHNPLGGPLEQGQSSDPVDDRRDDLDGRRARTDDAESPTVDGHAVVPARAVEHGPGEGVEPLQVGIARAVEDAGGGDHHIGLVPNARTRRGQVPPAVDERASVTSSLKRIRSSTSCPGRRPRSRSGSRCPARNDGSSPG